MHHEDPFVSVSFAGTFCQTFSIFRQRSATFMAIGGIVLIPYMATLFTITAFMMSHLRKTMKRIAPYDDDTNEFSISTYLSPDRIQTGMEEGETVVRDFLALVAFCFFNVFFFMVITIIGRGAMIRVVADVYMTYNTTDAPITWKRCLQSSFGRLFPLLGSNTMAFVGLIGLIFILFLVAFFAFIGVVLFSWLLAIALVLGCIVFYVYVLISFSLVSPGVIVENKGAFDGLQRSWELAGGKRFYLFSCQVFMGVLQQIVTLILICIFGSHGSGNIFAFLFTLEGIVVSMIPMLVFLPLATILETVMYFSIRVQRESLNRDVLVRDFDREVEPSMLMSSLVSGGSTTDYNRPDGEKSATYGHVLVMEKEDDVDSSATTMV